MRTCTLLLLLAVFENRAHADEARDDDASAHAHDGLYVAAMFSFGMPTITTSGISESDKLTGFRVRSSLGYRRGFIAIEPTLALASIDRQDYANNQSTTIEDWASVGAQVKVVGRGPVAWYAHLGPHRSWTQSGFMGRAALHGGGLEGGLGFQLGHREGAFAGGFMLEASHEVTWLGRDGMPSERISMTLLSLGFAAGNGF